MSDGHRTNTAHHTLTLEWANYPHGKGNLEEVVAIRDGAQDGYLNPRWIEWLLGFPLGWCDPNLVHLETWFSPELPNTSVAA